MARCSCPVSEQSITSFLPSEATQKAVDALLKTGIVQKFKQTGKNSVRGPNLLPDQSRDFTGTYPRVQADE